ncbi:endolytic transglycosylase MltG [Aquabacterium sp.]|uniref:endolytic transglycosylase MltG n=1 Tax=Aquabacterium sp. TaxID=1872578 RepID=UPI0024873661|nr:endolytic transglycosylase MltG [Aquabacterium sp.]MDI1259147.1 endolytic transglycosylase MltG [Aquabacterium sp.]
MSFLLGLLLLAAVACAGTVYWWVHQPLRTHGDDIELAIESGTTPREIARGWVEAGVDASPVMLYQWFRWSGQARQIRAGSYMLEPGATPQSLLRMMVMGDERLAVVKLIDGWTFKRFRAELAQADGLQASTAKLSDAQLMAQLGNPDLSPEGQFFPDTYSYAKGSTDLAVLKRAHRAMQKHLSDAWTLRGPSTSCPLSSPQEMLILASIVEKETGLQADRPMIAGVFCNRLRVRMPLQTDPTVIYGMGDEFDGNLKRSHLQTDTPYNTYMRTGLPPSPIAMPGKAALLATVHPAETNALYFVSRGDGSSVFSSTLAEHNRAVNQYQRKRP